VCNKLAAITNSIVINCNYRKCPEAKFPLPVYDAYAIFRHILKEAVQLGIDASKIGLIGESGGACIVLGVA
jgi:acetyl esterase